MGTKSQMTGDLKGSLLEESVALTIEEEDFFYMVEEKGLTSA